METNKTYKRVPFDIELAKKIQSGEVEGKIVINEDILDTNKWMLDKNPVNSKIEILSIKDNLCIASLTDNNELFIELPEKTPKTQADLCEESWLEDKKCKPYIQQLNKLKDYTQELMDVNQKVIDDLDSMVEDLKRICKLEETPKHEFKVGDKIKIIKVKSSKDSSFVQAIYLGNCYIIHEVLDNAEKVCVIDSIFGKVHFQFEEIEPYEEKHEFKPFDKVLVRASNFDKWKANFFSHMDDGYYKCVNSRYAQCIQYEGNEHLVGTTNNPE